MNLQNSEILYGVSGSISAYKSPLLLREFVKKGANVNTLITESAKKFVTKLTLQNLSKNHVIDDMFDESFQFEGSWHIKLAHDADLFIVAPASATTIGKIANGICDNALTAIAVALPENVHKLVCPAMDSTMWLNSAVQRNISLLKNYGFTVIEPEKGELASGIIGKGRLPEISNIINFIEKEL